MKLLVINPNTTESVTTLLLRQVRAAAGKGVTIDAVTARFGASYIADETSFAVAGHGVLDAWAAHRAECVSRGEPEADAVLIGCFGDPGCIALRELSGVPVIGLAEAAMREAAEHGRFAIVTGGAAWAPMLARLAKTLDLDASLAGIHVVAPTGAQLAADPQAAIALLRDACIAAAREAGAVILGGAALAGMAKTIAPEVPVPLIDSVRAGAHAALAALKAAQRSSPTPTPTPTPTKPSVIQAATGIAWQGLSAALLEGLRRRP